MYDDIDLRTYPYHYIGIYCERRGLRRVKHFYRDFIYLSRDDYKIFIYRDKNRSPVPRRLTISPSNFQSMLYLYRIDFLQRIFIYRRIRFRRKLD